MRLGRCCTIFIPPGRRHQRQQQQQLLGSVPVIPLLLEFHSPLLFTARPLLETALKQPQTQ